jgi:flagellar protein FlgJ
VPEPQPAPVPPASSAPRGQADFIAAAAQAARDSQRATGVPVSVTVAQAILESDWGLSQLSQQGQNYFGIKAHAREGSAGVVWFDTWEVINGQSSIRHEPFRAYASAADSFIDHGLLFIQNARYAGAMAARDDPREFARRINQAGYATDPNYAAKLIGLMDRFNLYDYDLP